MHGARFMIQLGENNNVLYKFEGIKNFEKE